MMYLPVNGEAAVAEFENSGRYYTYIRVGGRITWYHRTLRDQAAALKFAARTNLHIHGGHLIQASHWYQDRAEWLVKVVDVVCP